MDTQQPLTYQAFVSMAAADRAVVGLVLKGSRAHDGMITRYSDHDLYVILADGATTDLTRFAGHRTPGLDLVIISLADFRAASSGFERYALARATVVLDRLGGGITQILVGTARLGAGEAFRSAAEWLDAYANSLSDSRNVQCRGANWLPADRSPRGARPSVRVVPRSDPVGPR
jgi:hypothetical protein